MVQVDELAKMIEQKLNFNLNAFATGLQFKIFGTVGNYKKAVLRTDGTKQKFVNGVLRTMTGNFVPLKGVNNLFSSLMLEFAVPQTEKANVELVLSTWTEETVGEIYTMGGWSLLITPQPATAGVAKDTSPLGSTVPLLVVLNIQFIKSGMISNAVVWTIEGAPMLVAQANFSSNRTQDTKALANIGQTISNNQYETQSITLIVPYNLTSGVKVLVDDIFSGNKDKIYYITRDDGFATPLKAYYVMTNASVDEQNGKIISLTLTFMLADTEKVNGAV